MAQQQEDASNPESVQAVKQAKSWLLKARAIKSKLEDGVKKNDRDELVQEIRTVLAFTAGPPGAAGARDSSSAGTHQSYGSLRMPSRGMQVHGQQLIGVEEMSVGADFDMEASGSKSAPTLITVHQHAQACNSIHSSIHVYGHARTPR